MTAGRKISRGFWWALVIVLLVFGIACTAVWALTESGTAIPLNYLVLAAALPVIVFIGAGLLLFARNIFSSQDSPVFRAMKWALILMFVGGYCFIAGGMVWGLLTTSLR